MHLRLAHIWYLPVDAKSKFDQDFKRLPCIVEDIGSSLCQEWAVLRQASHGRPRYLEAQASTVPQLDVTSFTDDYSLTVITCDAEHSELLIVLLNGTLIWKYEHWYSSEPFYVVIVRGTYLQTGNRIKNTFDHCRIEPGKYSEGRWRTAWNTENQLQEITYPVWTSPSSYTFNEIRKMKNESVDLNIWT